MSEHVDIMDVMGTTKPAAVAVNTEPGDFGPLILYQSQSLTFVSFGLLVGVGAMLGLIHTWFYLGAYQIVSNPAQASQLALTIALGAPLSAYVVTRLLDINSWLSGEKTFLEYIRTVSFGLWGGLVGGLMILTSFAFMTQTPLLALLDAFAVGVPLAQVFGRLGCLNYGCCHGKECSSERQFGIRYQHSQAKVLRYDPSLKGKKLHPTQIYSALANLGIFVLILSLAMFWEQRPIGVLAAIYMSLYGLKRFSVEYLRGEFPRVYFHGLTIWQWFSLSFIAQGLFMLWLVFSRGEMTDSINFSMGFQGMQSALGVLVLTATIMGLVYGTHGRKIGSW